jgi:subtilisin family serine protease
LAALLVAVANGAATASTSGESERYVVVFHSPNSISAAEANAVAQAGGTITLRLPQIGAVGVESANPNFIADVEASALVNAADPDISMNLLPEGEATLDFEASSAENNGGTESPPGPDPQPMPDPLGNQQWDKMRLNATLNGSYAVQPGRDDVVVGVIDTGADVLPTAHADIAPNLDYARSAAFVDPTGAVTLPAPDHNPAMWDDRHGHGSWCLSAVAAPINQFGISGIAPNVTLVALIVYSGVNKFDIISMSLGGYYNHSEFNAIYVLVNRAIQFARQQGVLPVAALANNNFDLSDGEFMRDFLESPGEHPGVVGVAATGYYNQKAFYSNYGVDATDISAVGGSTRDNTGVPGTGVPVASPYRGQGRVLGAWSQENTGGVLPPLIEEHCDPATGNCYAYAWVQGTSMATPNAAGVAALIISQYGDPDMQPTQVESLLQITANNRPCPEPGTFTGGPGFTSADFDCEGAQDTPGEGAGYTNFFGKGIVDALKAVTFQSG